MSMESGFPFIAFYNVDEVIDMLEINSSVDTSFASCCQKIIDDEERAMIRLRDLV
jgi:hypothetical protein